MTNQKQVQVFFPRPSGQEPPPDNPFELIPVTRFADKTTPARGALEALLANITQGESHQGFFSLDTAGLSIGVLTISHSHATVDFFSGGAKSWSGDLSPGTFKLAVQSTLKQFPTVQDVIVMVDGDPDFASLE